MKRINRLLQLLLRLVSDFERNLSQPGGALRLTRRYLTCSSVEFGKVLWVGPDFRVQNNGRFSLGNRCGIGIGSRVYNHGSISIGEDFIAAPGLTLSTGTHNIRDMSFVSSKIIIGKRVWCGVRVTIIGDTEIGDDCVVAAGALVKGKFPPNSIIGGVPARIIGHTPIDRNEWHLEFTDQ